MRLIVTGDKSRYQFFRNMISKSKNNQKDFFTEKLGERDVYLTSNKQEVSEDVYYSEKLPLNTLVLFPKEYGNLSIDYESTDRIIVFDEFPYATDDDMENLEEVISSEKYGQIEVVIIKNNRLSLESDISTDEMAVREAKERYMKKDMLVYTYDMNDRPDFLIWTNWQKMVYKKQVFQPIIKKVRDAIITFDSVYEFDFEISGMSALTDFDILANFFKFESTIKGKNAWDIYYKRSYDYYWKNNMKVNMFYEEIYKNVIMDMCLWDLNYDLKVLGKFIRKQYSEEFSEFTPLVFNGEKNNYDEFLNVYKKEILKFKLKIKNFFTTKLRDILKQKIIRNVEKMEERMR